MEEKLAKKHTLTLLDQARLNMTGVTDVFAFDEKVIELETSQGYLDIEGDDLHIVKMNLDSGELIVEGHVSALIYQEQNSSSKKGSLLAKLFK
ncbi:MAG: sporulation protein YabP [Niameybacter sp.]|uniref:sporulation protein YabP n=1 Tax=Niameybacter sp. TaxID=2033640 RepID=UPI002FCAFA40